MSEKCLFLVRGCCTTLKIQHIIPAQITEKEARFLESGPNYTQVSGGHRTVIGPHGVTSGSIFSSFRNGVALNSKFGINFAPLEPLQNLRDNNNCSFNMVKTSAQPYRHDTSISIQS